MAWTVKKEDCDKYYQPNNHIKGHKWKSYDPEMQSAAFAQAVRELQLYLSREMCNPQTGTDQTYIYRDDYAVFEQALYILEKSNIQKEAGKNKVVKLGSKEKDVKSEDNYISPQAVRFLHISMIKIVRG